MDVGHMRYLRWSKVNDKAAWIAYNRMRGQQASALEHATPEAFWIDRTQCRYTDENGNIQNPSLTDCPQAVSAVKAIAIAASQGQKVYTITQKNAAVALPKLSLSKGVAEEIQNAVAAGKEVTVHEKAINAYGFSGFGYTIIDPETGVGGYLIEGKGNGSWAFAMGVIFGALLIATVLILISSFTGAAGVGAAIFARYFAGIMAAELSRVLSFFGDMNDTNRGCFIQGIVWAVTFAGMRAFGVWFGVIALAISIPENSATTQVAKCMGS